MMKARNYRPAPIMIYNFKKVKEEMYKI